MPGERHDSILPRVFTPSKRERRSRRDSEAEEVMIKKLVRAAAAAVVLLVSAAATAGADPITINVIGQFSWDDPGTGPTFTFENRSGGALGGLSLELETDQGAAFFPFTTTIGTDTNGDGIDDQFVSARSSRTARQRSSSMTCPRSRSFKRSSARRTGCCFCSIRTETGSSTRLVLHAALTARGRPRRLQWMRPQCRNRPPCC